MVLSSKKKGKRSVPATPPLARISMVFLLSHVLLPFAYPLVVGTSASTAHSSIPGTHGALSVAKTNRAAAVVSQSMSAASVDTSDKISIRQFLSRLNPASKTSDWKGGEYNATIPSRLLFRFASPLVNLAGERHLQEEDAFKEPKDRKMGSAVAELTSIYEKCRSKARTKLEQQKQHDKVAAKASESLVLAKALLLHQRRNLILTGSLRLINTAVQAFPALLVARLLRLIESGVEHHASRALLTAAALVAVLSLKMIVENQYFHHVVKGATQVRGSLAGLIFDKSLRLPSGGSGGAIQSSFSKKKNKEKKESLGAGGVLNLMQSDASILESTAMQLHTIWDGPLQIAMYTTLLFRYLGSSVIYGLLVLLLVIPLNSITLRILNRLSKYENEAKDARTKRTSESIANMKLLKLQAWEESFADDIRSHRRDELRRHVSRGLVRALNQAVSNAVPALVLVVTLSAYVKTGRPIVASTIFTAISLFNQLRFPLFFYPMLIDSLANGRNALRRCGSYLASEEVGPYVESMPLLNGQGGAVEMKSGNFLWSSSKVIKDGTVTTVAVPALCDVDLSVKPGEVVAVVGSVGVGKTAVIKALLGELAPVPRAVVDQTLSSSGSTLDALEIVDKPTVVLHGNVGYCSQEAWLPKGTIREAIVFGREYDEERYLKSVRDAGLDGDIVDSINGANSKEAASRGVLSHDTDVGEGGSSLSGGQRARVALARALYGDDQTKVFLLDDPLAALDASVGSMVFERMTERLRSSNAAVLLVTNDPSLPRRCDRVILMGKYSPYSSSCSTVIDSGTYDELLARGHDLRSLSRHAEDETGNGTEELEPIVSSSEGETLIESKMPREETIRVVGGYEVPSNVTDRSYHADPDCQKCMENLPDYIADHVVPIAPLYLDEVSKVDVSGRNATTNGTPVVKKNVELKMTATRKLASPDDAMTTGAVPRSTYVAYFKSVRKPLLVAAMVLSYLMANGAQFFQQYIVAKWTEIGTGDSMAVAMGGKYLRSLVNAAGVVSVFLWLRSFLTMRVGVRASEFLHNRMVSSVFAAPISFFDATPSGQLLSRFGKEMETVDRALPDSIGSVLFCFLQIFFSGAALAGIITPAMLVPLFAIGTMYVRTMSRFRPAARDLKRSESRSRSPIYTHFGEAVRGTEIIRSIPGADISWSSDHRALMDRNLSVFYAVKALDRWLSIRLETLGNVVVFTSAVASVFLTRTGKLKAGSAGWGLTQALAITGLLTWAVRCLTDLETHMMSVMRVKELTDLDSDSLKGKFPDASRELSLMPKEAFVAGEALRYLERDDFSTSIAFAPLSDEALLKDGWPWKGNTVFRNVSMRYNSLSPLVLKDVTIGIPPGTTLGIVGRTGSGKSSLLLTLFRLVEVEPGGSIEIDGVDIRSVSLSTLRGSLSIIPQDPVLFAGTVMYNLDATGTAKPEDAWAALQSASPALAQQFRNAGTGLDTQITEGGKNLSLGQRQLICLARALLRKSKILVMDEATSSVDAKTDSQVQETIRREFVDKGVSVITVAHRLDTVLGYDKIAVLGSGKLLEYGSPADLLKNRNGELRRLVDADRLNKRKGAAANMVIM